MYKYMQAKKDLEQQKLIQRNLSILMLANQLAFTFIYYLLCVLCSYGLFKGKTQNIQKFLQAWLVFYSLIFVISGIISMTKLSQYDKTDKIGKVKKGADITSLTLDCIYFVVEFLVLIELFKKIYFATPIKNNKFSLYEVACIVILSVSLVITTGYTIESAIDLYKKPKENTAEALNLTRNILVIITTITGIMAYVMCNLENRGIVNGKADVKLLGIGLFILSALFGSSACALSVYDAFRNKDKTLVLDGHSDDCFEVKSSDLGGPKINGVIDGAYVKSLPTNLPFVEG